MNVLSAAQEPDWLLNLKTVKVFQSTKQDVEIIFKNPKETYSSNKDGKETGWGEVIEYQRPDGNLRVFYSTGKCSKTENNNGWDLSDGVIVNIEFEPVEAVRLQELNLDLTTFKRSQESDNANWNYRSDQLGINFTVLEGKVTSMKYSLTPEMRVLDCEIVLKKVK